MVDEWVKKVWEEARREREERIRKLERVSEALEVVINYLAENGASDDILEVLTELQVSIDRKITRAIFDSKVSEIMEKYGYVDIDEGTYEAISERTAGTVKLYYEDDRVDVWFYRADLGSHRVELLRDEGFEGEFYY